MSSVYKVNQSYKIEISLELTIDDVIDHFPNLEGLVRDLMTEPEIVRADLQESLNKIEGDYDVDTTTFDLVKVKIKNPKIIKISKK